MFVSLNLDEKDVYINLLQIETITIFRSHEEEVQDSTEGERFYYHVEIRFTSGDSRRIVSGSTGYRAEYERKMDDIKQEIDRTLLAAGVYKRQVLELPDDDD